MKRSRFIKICITLCLILGMITAPFNQFSARAEESITTVHGTIQSGTTSDLLKLSTKEGNMEIKLDSGTDTSACKILLPDKKIDVSVSHGSDGYLHAVKITSESQTVTNIPGSPSTVTVSGTIGDKSKDDVLYFNTSQGEMQIKLDATTSMSGCSVLVMGKTYYISCVRGSDAYMHAVSISDTPLTNATVNTNGATASISGTVSGSTKENLLYLSTSGGEMQFVIDGGTDTSKGMVHTPGSSLTVSYYRGSDAYLHAAAIVGVKDNPSGVEIDSSSTLTATGTVENNSTENTLYLNTPQGKMELKLDAVSSVNLKALISGRKLTVTCARGSDAYLHAITISAA